MSARVVCSGNEPGQRQLAGIQTTGREYRNLSQPQYVIRQEDNVAVARRDGIRLLRREKRALDTMYTQAMEAPA